MGERITQTVERSAINVKGPVAPTAEVMGRRLLEIIVYTNICRAGGRVAVDDLAESSEVGDWKMPDFKAACSYASSQGWLLVENDALTLTSAGLAAA